LRCGGKRLWLWGQTPLSAWVDVFGCCQRRMTFISGQGEVGLVWWAQRRRGGSDHTESVKKKMDKFSEIVLFCM